MNVPDIFSFGKIIWICEVSKNLQLQNTFHQSRDDYLHNIHMIILFKYIYQNSLWIILLWFDCDKCMLRMLMNRWKDIKD